MVGHRHVLALYLKPRFEDIAGTTFSRGAAASALRHHPTCTDRPQQAGS